MVRFLILITVLCGLSCCNRQRETRLLPQPENTEVGVEDRLLYPSIELSPWLDSLRPAEQMFDINCEKDTSIISKNGTVFEFLSGAFVNKKGGNAKAATIKLVEITTIGDVIMSNFQTMSGDKPLQTAGMFFIDAFENGVSLDVANGRSIRAEMPSNFSGARMKQFDGAFDKLGRIDWINPTALEGDLIPIPLKLLDFSQIQMEEDDSGRTRSGLLDALRAQDKYENTYIATREFEARAKVLEEVHFAQLDIMVQKAIKIYTAELARPLFIADSLVAAMIWSSYGTQIDTLKLTTSDKKNWSSYAYSTFIDFYNEHRTTVINFDKLDINDGTTASQLVARGHSQFNSDKYVSLFRQRSNVIASRTRERIIQKSVSQAIELRHYAITINKLGWINIDQFLKDGLAVNSDISVNLNTNDSLDFVSVSLVIPDYNMVIASPQTNGMNYRFTDSDDSYLPLPIGREAIVVVLASGGGKLYFGKQRMKILQKVSIDLPVRLTNVTAIKKDVKVLTKNRP